VTDLIYFNADNHTISLKEIYKDAMRGSITLPSIGING
jgi:hypothetical protein